MFVTDNKIQNINNSFAIKKYNEFSPVIKTPIYTSKNKISKVPEDIISKIEEFNKNDSRVLEDFKSFHKLKSTLNGNLDKIFSEVKNIEKRLKNVSASGDYESLSNELNKSIRKNLDNLSEYSDVSINDFNSLDNNFNVVYKTLSSTVLFSITEQFSIEDLDMQNNEKIFEKMYRGISDIKSNISKTEKRIGTIDSLPVLEKKLEKNKEIKINELKETKNIENFIDILV
jgi:hypothetical protein